MIRASASVTVNSGSIKSRAVMESSTQLPSTSTAKNFEYEYKYWYWKMNLSTSTVKNFEYEYFYKFNQRTIFKL